MLVIALLRSDRRNGAVAGGRIRILVDPLFDDVTEVADQALDRPGGRIAEGADGVAFDLLGHREQHVDFALLGAAFDHAFHDAHHPACAFAARRALAAAFMLEEGSDPPDGTNDVGRLVHDDHAAGAERGLLLAHAVKVHDGIHHVFAAHDWARSTTRNDGEEIVPAAADAAAMLFNDVLERFAQGFLEGRRLVHMARDHEQLGADIVRTADGIEPGAGATEDFGDDGDRLDVVHGGRVAIDAHAGRERRLETGLALLAFERFHQGGFFAADVGAGAVMDDDVQIPAVYIVLADQLGVVGFLNGLLKTLALAHELAAHVDEGKVRIHGAGCQQAPLDQMVRIVAQDLAVLARAGLGFVGVDEEIMRAAIADLGHEAPLEAGGEASAATAAQTRTLDLIGDPITAGIDEFLGADIGSTGPRAFEAPIVLAIEI